MLPKRSKSKLLDKVHRFGVYTCMALTLYGVALGSYKAYYYITYTKPEMQMKKEALKRQLLEADREANAF